MQKGCFKGIIGIALWLFVCAGYAHAQDLAPGYTVKHWGTEDGLPVSEVNHIWKTSDGYMWMRNSEGVVRFDGKTFTQFNSANNVAFTSSSSNHLVEKGIDQFWFNNGLNDDIRLVRYKNGSFTHFPFLIEKTHPGYIPHLHFDLSLNGELWIAGNDGLYFFENETFSRAYEDLIVGSVKGVTAVGKSVLAAVEGGFYHIKEGEISFTEHDNKDLVHFTLDESGAIWLSTETEVKSIKARKIRTHELPLATPSRHLRINIIESDVLTPDRFLIANFITGYVFENGQRKLVYTENDVFENNIPLLTEFTLEGNKGWVKAGTTLWHKNELVTTSIIPEFGKLVISKLFVDENGSAWLGTGKGLYQYNKSIIASYGNRDGIDNVYPLFQDSEGAVWTSSNGGVLSRVDNGQVERLTENREFPRAFAFYEDSNKNIWIGNSHGIQIWNRQLGTFSTLDAPFGGQGVRVSVIRENESENLWIGSRKGFYEYNRGERIWERIPDEKGNDVRVTQMYESEEGNIWIGSQNDAVFLLKGDTLYAMKDNSRLSGVNVRSIYQDSDGVLWVGFQGGGLNRIELAEDGISAANITKYNSEDGLFGSVIHTILEDEYERFWMSSNQGVFWIDKAQLNEFAAGNIDRISPVVYQEEDGLPGNEANGAAQNSGLVANDGSFWFAMRYGLANIHPDSVQALAYAFPAKVESITYRDSVWAANDGQLEIPKESRDINISYTAFNYRVKSEDIRFSYVLEGLQSEWTYAGTNREASFTNLPAGDYTFKVKAGVSGQWDDVQLGSVSFSIQPYFYETSFFYGILIVIGSSVLIGLIIWGNRKLEFQRKQYELEVKEQEEAISENEIFLNELQAYIEERIDHPKITAIELSLAMSVSERQLYRIVKNVTDFTPQQFVREIRLKRAHQILETQQVGTIAEAAYSVGFSTPFYFSKIFEERFECHPSELIK